MKWLVDLRKSKGMKAVEMARQINVSRSRYCNIEKGRGKPTIAQAKRLANILGFDWTRFYDDIS